MQSKLKIAYSEYLVSLILCSIDLNCHLKYKYKNGKTMPENMPIGDLHVLILQEKLP